MTVLTCLACLTASASDARSACTACCQCCRAAVSPLKLCICSLAVRLASVAVLSSEARCCRLACTSCTYIPPNEHLFKSCPSHCNFLKCRVWHAFVSVHVQAIETQTESAQGCACCLCGSAEVCSVQQQPGLSLMQLVQGRGSCECARPGMLYSLSVVQYTVGCLVSGWPLTAYVRLGSKTMLNIVIELCVIYLLLKTVC